MTATYKQAVDDILGLFKTAWDTTSYIAIYPNVGGEVPSNVENPWARATVQHIDGGQASLSGGLGTQRWERSGIFTVQIFVPSGEGLSEAHILGKLITDIFEGVSTTNGVWFKNVRINEIGPDGEWYNLNVLIDFTYDEVK